MIPNRPDRRHTLPMGLTVAATASLAAFLIALAPTAQAQEAEFSLVIRNHRFEPTELKVPAGKKVKLVVHNLDSSAEEFESDSLRREKVVPAGQKVTIFVGPLKAGSYPFIGEFHKDTAQGKLIAE